MPSSTSSSLEGVKVLVQVMEMASRTINLEVDPGRVLGDDCGVSDFAAVWI